MPGRIDPRISRSGNVICFGFFLFSNSLPFFKTLREASPRTKLLSLGFPANRITLLLNLWRGLLTNRIALPGLPHEQNYSTWALSTNRISLPGLSHEQNYSTFKPLERSPHERNCCTWASPRTELLPSLFHEQNCYLAVPTDRIATMSPSTNRTAT